MTSPLAQLAWDECLLVPERNAEAEGYLKREAGSAPAWSRYFLASPWFAKAMVRIGYDKGLLIALDFETANLTALVVSQENSCRYCYAAARAMMRLLGMNEESMQALEKRLAVPELDPRGAAAVRFARRMARANPLAGKAERKMLEEAGFTAAEIRELAFAIASTAFMNRLSTIAALPPQPWESAPDRWYMRLLQPLMARMIKGMAKRGAPAALPADAPKMFGALIRAYDGSPIARTLADMLRDLWQSDVLPRRTKALMFAVAAQGFGCSASRMEACELLRLEGLEQAQVDGIVSHLSGPGLSAEDNALLAFARDSLWYEPQTIQRRARALRDQVGTAKFVEALGVVTVANSTIPLAAFILAAP